MPGTQELIIIGFIVLLLFGAKKLPQLGKSLGQSINSFKKGLKESDQEDEKLEDSSKNS